MVRVQNGLPKSWREIPQRIHLPKNRHQRTTWRLGFLLELWEALLHKAFTHDLRRHTMAGRYEVMYDVYDMYI